MKNIISFFIGVIVATLILVSCDPDECTGASRDFTTQAACYSWCSEQPNCDGGNLSSWYDGVTHYYCKCYEEKDNITN